jgi:hypothetical protein
VNELPELLRPKRLCRHYSSIIEGSLFSAKDWTDLGTIGQDTDDEFV